MAVLGDPQRGRVGCYPLPATGRWVIPFDIGLVFAAQFVAIGLGPFAMEAGHGGLVPFTPAAPKGNAGSFGFGRLALLGRGAFGLQLGRTWHWSLVG
jgi:hypothetical protein